MTRTCAVQEVSDTAGAELSPLLLVDTAGADMEELADAAGSKSTAGEANLALAHVRKLVAAGLKPQNIGVISPYSAQVRCHLLRAFGIVGHTVYRQQHWSFCLSMGMGRAAVVYQPCMLCVTEAHA